MSDEPDSQDVPMDIVETEMPEVITKLYDSDDARQQPKPKFDHQVISSDLPPPPTPLPYCVVGPTTVVMRPDGNKKAAVETENYELDEAAGDASPPLRTDSLTSASNSSSGLGFKSLITESSTVEGGAEDGSLSEELYPLAVLIDELRSEDAIRRLEAIRRISTIAIALGPERARTELLPFFADTFTDEDEVLCVLAQQLSVNFIPYIGGAEYAQCLLVPLEALLSAEDPLVRETAIASICSIMPKHTKEAFDEKLMPMMARLTAGEWYTSRSSVCFLFAPMYKLANDAQKTELRRFYLKLSHDDMPMVRRAAAQCLPQMAEVMEEELVLSYLMPILAPEDIYEGGVVKPLSPPENSPPRLPNPNGNEEVAILRDEQDSVRALAVAALVGVTRRLRDMEAKERGREKKSESFSISSIMNTSDSIVEPTVGESLVRCLACFKTLFTDPAWRVRCAIGQRLAEVCIVCFPGGWLKIAVALGDEYARVILASGVALLIGDAELEVRAMALEHLPELVEALKEEDRAPLIEACLPHLGDITGDESNDLKQLLAVTLMKIAEYVPRASLVQLCTLLLAERSSEIRLAIIANLENMTKRVGALFDALLPAFVQLKEDSKWRVRLSLVEQLPALASHLDNSFFDAQLTDFAVASLGDQVFAVREKAAQVLRSLVKQFGPEWNKAHVLKQVTELVKEKNYLLRVSALIAIHELAEVADTEALDMFVGILQKLASDPVPNVRIRVATSTLEVAKFVDERVRAEKLRPLIAVLVKDVDVDVRYFANISEDGMEE